MKREIWNLFRSLVHLQTIETYIIIDDAFSLLQMASCSGVKLRTLGFREGNICEVVTIAIDGRFIPDSPVAIEDKTTWSDFCGIFKRFSCLVGFCPSTVVP